MSAKILDGKALAEKIKLALHTKIAHLRKKPSLAVILVGDDPASKIYVGSKRKACKESGIESLEYALKASTTEAELLGLIQTLNQNPAVTGILVQLPLPKHMNSDKIILAIDPKKDVDGFHPYNMGLLAANKFGLRPCTPKGVMTLLHHHIEQLAGLHAVVVGTSNIVGRPMALELINARCTVTVCHSKTRDLAAELERADLVVSATGKVNLIQAHMIKDGAIVVDVGINRIDNKIVGDVDFEEVKKIASYITPVPGGVGPMTVACLLENTLEAHLLQGQQS